MESYIWFIPLLPLLGFIINGIGRNVFPKNLISFIGCASILISFILSILVFQSVGKNDSFIFTKFNIINIDQLIIPFAFQIDSLTTLFLLIITGIGLLIHIYSTAYMSHDKGYGRYFSYLNLFIFFMLLLVMGNNFLIMFIGWEGVGLCSFLLIGFWYKNKKFVEAAKKAFIMNRIGDIGFLVAMFWMLFEFGTLEYQLIFSKINPTLISTGILTGISLLLFLAATGKSAQIPLFTWLPDAMAGPTPVSALIHAATMVTAGIFLITRCNPIFSVSPFTLELIAWIGILTAFIAATIAICQNDIKKVLAYSTVSQLGLMFASLGVGAYIAAVFHVITHAFFKALMFLGAGSVIHGMNEEQDMTKMGGLRKFMPITHITFLIGCLAISGIPPLSGFFSKDEMLLNMFINNKLIYGLGFIVSVLTSFYMFRLYALTFLGNLKTDIKPYESPKAMTLPLIILAFLSIIGGFIGIPELFKINANFLNNYLSGVVKIPTHSVSHSTEWILMISLLICVIIAIILAIKKYSNPSEKEKTGIMKVFENKWYIDELYNNTIVMPVWELGGVLKQYVEKLGIIKLISKIGNITLSLSKRIRLLQDGYISHYVMMMIVGIIILLYIFFTGHIS